MVRKHVVDEGAPGRAVPRVRERGGKVRGEAEKEIAAKNLPGCVVLISRHGKIVFREVFGNKRIEPDSAPMTIDTVFDLASLTKPIAPLWRT